MGSGNFNIKAYQVQASEAKASGNSGFAAVTMCDEFNPAKVHKRFSKKGPFNEFRDVITALIGLDVTGSMNKIPKSLLEGKLGSLMVDLKKTFNNPNENLQISFAGIGDAKSDKAPLQVTHFESDNRFAQQLQKIWLEGGGGGNGAESYNLLWWYAANKTSLNYVKQDKRKGILITIGDDNVHPSLTASEIRTCLNPDYEGGDLSNQVLLDAAREQYEVYHIIVTDGDSYKYDALKRRDKTEQQKKDETQQWKKLLGEDNVILSESNSVADAIANIVKKHRPIQKTEQMNLTEEEWRKQNKENLSDEQWKEVLSYTLCPLTREFMTRPVCWGNNKRAYEEQAVEKYVREHRMDPMTQKKLTSELVLTLNPNIAQLCLNYKSSFDALPENRRARLVQLTLDQIHDEDVKNKEIGENPHALFSEKKSKQDEEEIVNEYKDCICSISLEIMEDPVMLVASGHTYNRKHIEEWLSKKKTDPYTGVGIEDTKLVPNYALRDRCEKARAKLTKPAQNLSLTT